MPIKDRRPPGDYYKDEELERRRPSPHKDGASYLYGDPDIHPDGYERPNPTRRHPLTHER
ncbi:MAG: hypothetical protein WAO98_00945 [Alphaproteobacteria bacterium]